jgi:AcrR family transcriptional regulator
MARVLTRDEAKQVTRNRLLDAALRLLSQVGYAGLSASAIAREAGVAQPTFYVHFRDKDELIRTLAETHMGELRRRLRDARDTVRRARDVASIRETFRVALATMIRDPGLFLLYTRERAQPGSPFGEQARRLAAETRRDLAEDLVGFGLPATTAAERARVDAIAESMVAQTEALGLGYLEGRYEDLDALIDVLASFAAGLLGPTPS